MRIYKKGKWLYVADRQLLTSSLIKFDTGHGEPRRKNSVALCVYSVLLCVKLIEAPDTRLYYLNGVRESFGQAWRPSGEI